MPLTVGGGVRSTEDVRALLEAGADKVSINTAVVREASRASRGREVRGAMYRGGDRCEACWRQRQGAALEIFTHGGREPTGIDAIAMRKRLFLLPRRRGDPVTSMDRRHARRVRQCADPRDRRCGIRSGHRERRRRHVAASRRRRSRGACLGGALRPRFSISGEHSDRGQTLHGRCGLPTRLDF